MKHTRLSRMGTALLASTLAFSVGGQALAFSDVAPAHWFYDNVTRLVSVGVVSGYEDDTFRPQNQVTYGEAYKLLCSILALPPTGTGNHWASGYAQTALEFGLTDALPANLDTPMNRLQVADLLTSILSEPDAPISNPYVDTDAPAALLLYDWGIMQGDVSANGLVFRPADSITRAEFCAVLSRIGDLLELDTLYGQSPTFTYPMPEAPRPSEDAQPTREYLEEVILYMMVNDVYNYVMYFDGYDGRQLESEYDIFDTTFNAFVNVQDAYHELGGFYETIQYGWTQADGASRTQYTITLSDPDVSNEQITAYKADFLEGMEDLATELYQTGRITDDMTEYEMACVFYEYCADTYSYDYSYAPLSYTGYGMLTNNKGVCQGYVSVFNTLCKLYGIDVVGCSGNSQGEDHIWSIAQLDGVTYYIDPTWGDTSKSGGQTCNYRYFTDSYDQFARDHTFEDRT